MRDADLDPDDFRGNHDDPGPAHCRCGWPLVNCQAVDGQVPDGYDYAKRLDMKPGDPCPKSAASSTFDSPEERA